MHSDVGQDDLKDCLFSAPSFNDLAAWLIFVTFYEVEVSCSKRARRLEGALKHLIFSSRGSDLLGGRWEWRYYIEIDVDGKITLYGEQDIVDDQIHCNEAIPSIVDGADLCEKLDWSVREFADPLSDQDRERVATSIASFDPAMAEEFRDAERILGERDADQAKQEWDDRVRKLAPFRHTIDEYAEIISDTPLRYPGGGSYGTRRGWIILFMEQYVLEHGRLPVGEHTIKVNARGSGYSGGTHNFGIQWR
jgi:hypothetical protein